MKHIEIRHGVLDAQQYLPTAEELERAQAQWRKYLHDRHAELDRQFKREASHGN